MLSAEANSNLLDAKSWTKSKEPVFRQSVENKVFATGNFAFIPSPNGKETCFIYHARSIENEASGALDSRSPRMQKVEWDADGFPVFGIPLAETEVIEIKK
jgi:GH43 family beta-xylosidase